MRKDYYTYPAIFTFDSDGISVEFPDLPGCLTCGDTEEEAYSAAKEALALHLYGMEQDKEEIPEPSKLKGLTLEENQIFALINVWMVPFRDEMRNKAVKKTLTIPKWLDEVATANKVNFSRILQDALMNYLGIDEHGNPKEYKK